jgi:flagellar biosynthesis/type III secretory pathway protein FliH
LSRETLTLPAPPTGVRVLAHGHEAVMAMRLARARAAGRAAAAEVLNAAVARLEALEAESKAALAHTATELALEIARTLLRSELKSGRYEIEPIVRATLGEAAIGRSPCVVHLNPVDLARLADVKFRSGTRLEADEGVGRGDVHVETPLGLFVREIDGALAAIGKRLREELA